MTHGQHITPHHLSGDGLKIKLVSTETYPIGILLDRFSNDVAAAPPTEADFQQGTSLEVFEDRYRIKVHGICTAIHTEPGSREAHALNVLRELSERRKNGPESIHMFVEYANGDKYLYSGGVILTGSATKYDRAFVIHFSRLQKLTDTLLRACGGDLLALA